MIVDAVVGLGSSLGDRQAALRLAVMALDALSGTTVVAVSRTWETVPFGAARLPFLNAAVRLRTSRSARGLLAACKAIERRLGRAPSRRWGDRALDLDLLLWGGAVRPGNGLRLPHPGLCLRRSALEPAREVAPDLVHPLAGLRLDRLPLPAGPAPRPAGVLPAPPPVLAAGRARRYTAPPAQADPRRMKIFLDTANLDEIRQVASWGILDGVTTNPSLLSREGGDFVEHLHQICEIAQGPVSAETVAEDVEGMVREGRLLARVHEHIVVKVPMGVPGLRAARALSDEGIDVNVTLVFQAAQALLAARAGAAYVSPFLGRLDDIGADGVGLIEQIVQIYGNHPEMGAEILAASIRSPQHLVEVAIAGADVATVPFRVLEALVRHPLTDAGLTAFLEDWRRRPDADLAGQVERWLQARSR